MFNLSPDFSVHDLLIIELRILIEFKFGFWIFCYVWRWGRKGLIGWVYDCYLDFLWDGRDSLGEFF